MRRLSLQRWSLLKFRENSVIFALTPLMTRKIYQKLAEPTNTRGSSSMSGSSHLDMIIVSTISTYPEMPKPLPIIWGNFKNIGYRSGSSLIKSRQFGSKKAHRLDQYLDHYGWHHFLRINHLISL
jgi:hypothetical protein